MSREYLIEILHRQRQQQNRQKTMVLPSRRYEPLGRRRFGDIYINYYDRGAFADGTDVPFCIIPNCTNIYAVGGVPSIEDNPYHLVQISGVPVSTDPTREMIVNANGAPPTFQFDSVEYQDILNEHLFASEPETWASTYRKIDDTLSPEYSLGATGALGYISNKGWKIDKTTEKGGEISATSVLHFMVFSTGAISPDWPINGNLHTKTNCKVTTAQDYASSSVDFTLDANCDVFLTPAITFNWGFAYQPNLDESLEPNGPNSGDGNPSTYDAGYPQAFGLRSETWLLNALYQPLSRARTINNTNWDDLLASGGLPFKTDLSTSIRNWWRSSAISDPDARLLYYSFNDGQQLGGGAWDTSYIQSVGVNNFPQDPATHYGDVYLSSLRPYVGVMLVNVPEGCCIAQIKKKGIWYYVWNTNYIILNNATYGGFV